MCLVLLTTVNHIFDCMNIADFAEVTTLFTTTLIVVSSNPRTIFSAITLRLFWVRVFFISISFIIWSENFFGAFCTSWVNKNQWYRINVTGRFQWAICILCIHIYIRISPSFISDSTLPDGKQFHWSSMRGLPPWSSWPVCAEIGVALFHDNTLYSLSLTIR